MKKLLIIVFLSSFLIIHDAWCSHVFWSPQKLQVVLGATSVILATVGGILIHGGEADEPPSEDKVIGGTILIATGCATFIFDVAWVVYRCLLLPHRTPALERAPFLGGLQ